jgi:lipopolysaccharide/colanic/teichoic acid biosynthesis glycosyltransferase
MAPTQKEELKDGKALASPQTRNSGYVKNFSILFDCVILLQTLREVLWPSGAR